MLNLFGRRKTVDGGKRIQKHQSSQDSAGDKFHTLDTLATMRETAKNIDKREKFLSIRAQAQLDEAKAKVKAGDKNGAMTAMIRKKMFDKEVFKLIQMKANLESQMLSIESANVTLDAKNGMQVGLTAQKALNEQINLDDLAELHEEINEQLNNVDEAGNILGSQYDSQDVYDEDELLNELKAEIRTELESSNAETEYENQALALPEVRQELSLPTAPKTKIEIYSNDDEEDLKKLEMEMGL